MHNCDTSNVLNYLKNLEACGVDAIIASSIYILKLVDKYQESDLIIPLNGKYYNLNKDGILTVSGNTSVDYVAIKLSKEDKLIYWDTVSPDINGDFRVEFKLPEKGKYILKINNEEECSEIIDYVNNGYVSIEDKLTYADNIRIEYGA